MPQKVVIVGAGASARVVTKTLKENKADVHITIVQPNKFASLPWFQTLILTKRDSLVENTTYQTVPGADETVYGVAVACADGTLAVQPLDEATGSKDDSAPVVEVPFDVLVAATGIKFPLLVETPGQSYAERQSEIENFSKALLSGKNVVISGGGATGIELAADLLEALPKETRKGKVTLICTGDRLMADQPQYYGERAREVLEGLGCTIIFNDRVSSHSDSAVAEGGTSVALELKSGKKLSCEAYVACYSRGANTSWLTTAHNGKSLASKIVNGKGQVEVNDFLQSAVYEKLYAVGAATNRKEPSLVMNVESQAKTVAANIKAPKSTEFPGGPEHAVYQTVGRETFAMIVPESLPMPAFCSTLCCTWCGFPFNLLCPCFCCGVVCGPLDPMTCGYCCGKPEGEGLTKTLAAAKKSGMLASSVNYNDLGKGAPTEQAMSR